MTIHPDLAAAAAHTHTLRQQGKTVVFTNGHFDLLHIGHLDYLEKASLLGDALFVALNDDASTQRLKGTGRPITPAPERARLVAALKPVTATVVFNGDTAHPALEALRPHIYVKGGDYAHKPLPERELVTELGGRVVLIDYLPAHSTTDIIARVRALP